MISLTTKRYLAIHPTLKKLIKYYWIIESTEPVEFNHKLIPVGNVDLIINRSSPIKYTNHLGEISSPKGNHLTGIRDSYCWINQKGVLSVIGISFSQLGLFPILKTPISEISNSITELELVSKAFAKAEYKVYNSKHTQDTINIIENELLQILDPTLIPSKEVYKIVHYFNKDIFRYDIQDFCAKYGINQRRLERIFNKYIGVSPKRLHKITQCKHILNCLKYMGSNSLTTLAYDCGFYDQNHFIKDFKAYTGNTPTEYLKQNSTVKQIIDFSESIQFN